MTRATLAKQLALLEGGKSQARIADIREVLKLICMLEASYRVKWSIEAGGNDTYLHCPDDVLECLSEDAEKMARKAYKKMQKKK